MLIFIQVKRYCNTYLLKNIFMWKDFQFAIFFSFLICIPLHFHLILVNSIISLVLYDPYFHLPYVNKYITYILFKITKNKTKYSIKLQIIAYIWIFITIEFFQSSFHYNTLSTPQAPIRGEGRVDSGGKFCCNDICSWQNNCKYSLEGHIVSLPNFFYNKFQIHYEINYIQGYDHKKQ